MKKLTLLFAVLVALSATLLGCEQKQTPAQAPAASAPANPEAPAAAPAGEAKK